MRIAEITDSFYPDTGGISTTSTNFCKRLKKLGEKVFVLNNSYHNEKLGCFQILSSGKYLKSIKDQDFHFFLFIFRLLYKIMINFKGLTLWDRINLSIFYCFYPRNLVSRILSIKNIIDFYKKNTFDVLFSTNSVYPLFYSFIISKWFKIPLITLAHGDDFIKRFHFNINSRIFKYVDNIIFSNKIMQNLFLKLHVVKKEKTTVVLRAVNTDIMEVKESKDELRSKFKMFQKDFIVLTVSRLSARKGINTVIKSIKLILDENPNIPIKYFIIGEGDQEKFLKEMVCKLNLERYIFFLGPLSNDLRNKYYKLSDIFILVPERLKKSIEGFGIVYIEANYFKLPVIGSLSGGIKEAIVDGKSGFLIKSNNEEALKNKILLLYKEEDLRKNIGNFGYERTNSQFNWDIISRVYQNLLRKEIISLNKLHN